LSKGTLYLYYKSKEDLFLAVSMRGMEILEESFLKAISTGEPTLKLIANIGAAYFDYFEKHRNYFRMMSFWENPQYHSMVSPEMFRICEEHDKKLWDPVLSVIQKAIDEGVLHRELNPLEVGVMLWSNSTGIMRLIDRQASYWRDIMGLDLQSILQKSNAFLVEAMMTDEAKKKYPSTILYHSANNRIEASGVQK
jgi:AcrR family transcriptional regulator